MKVERVTWLLCVGVDIRKEEEVERRIIALLISLNETLAESAASFPERIPPLKRGNEKRIVVSDLFQAR